MKKYFYIIIIFISASMNAQTQANVFDDTAQEQERTEAYTDIPEKEPEIAYNIGNPGEPVPIDDYIPLLLIAAMGLIVYNTYRKKTLS